MTPDTPPANPTGESPSLFSPAAAAAFRAFLRRRLPDEATAEDILQQAFAKTWETRADMQARTPTRWFYRVLRHAVADYYRERAVREKRDARYLAEETRETVEAEPLAAADNTPCECFKPLLAGLRPKYAEILRLTDLEGHAPRDAAARLGLTSGNAHVRLHRARGALRQRLRATCGSCAAHGCLNCGCRTSPASRSAGV